MRNIINGFSIVKSFLSRLNIFSTAHKFGDCKLFLIFNKCLACYLKNVSYCGVRIAKVFIGVQHNRWNGKIVEFPVYEKSDPDAPQFVPHYMVTRSAFHARRVCIGAHIETLDGFIVPVVAADPIRFRIPTDHPEGRGGYYKRILVYTREKKVPPKVELLFKVPAGLKYLDYRRGFDSPLHEQEQTFCFLVALYWNPLQALVETGMASGNIVRDRDTVKHLFARPRVQHQIMVALQVHLRAIDEDESVFAAKPHRKHMDTLQEALEVLLDRLKTGQDAKADAVVAVSNNLLKATEIAGNWLGYGNGQPEVFKETLVRTGGQPPSNGSFKMIPSRETGARNGHMKRLVNGEKIEVQDGEAAAEVVE